MADGLHCGAAKPGRAICKMGMALDAPFSVKYRDRWLKSLTYSLVYEFAHVPIMRALALNFYRRFFDRNASFVDMASIEPTHCELQEQHFALYRTRNFLRKRVNVTLPMQLDFAEFYGLSVADLNRAESYILGQSGPLPIVLNHWVLDAVVSRDV